MTQLLVPNVSDELHDKLRRRAESHGRTVEDEVREILQSAVSGSATSAEQGNLGTRIHKLFAEAGGIDEPIEEQRGWGAPPPEFET